ncbi:MAG: hypothetical protein K2W96_23605 [Gemmataceae bacterium]|nr:hypothetical protein [Gemmataceae bacterium]
MALLRRSVKEFDRTGWALDEGYAARLMAGIVGFRMEGVRLEGKAKLSQNQSRARRERVAARVGGEMAERMRSALEKGGGVS